MTQTQSQNPAPSTSTQEPSETAAKPESFVDEVFDLLTARASKALVVVAKWLEERAKAASALATKLDHSTR